MPWANYVAQTRRTARLDFWTPVLVYCQSSWCSKIKVLRTGQRVGDCYSSLLIFRGPAGQCPCNVFPECWTRILQHAVNAGLLMRIRLQEVMEFSYTFLVHCTCRLARDMVDDSYQLVIGVWLIDGWREIITMGR